MVNWRDAFAKITVRLTPVIPQNRTLIRKLLSAFFDTVASLANPVAQISFCFLGAGALLLPSAILAYFGLGFWHSYVVLAIGAGLLAAVIHTALRVRFEFGLPRSRRWRVFHFTAPRMRFYDTELDPNVRHARHAIAIDEFRPSFGRVPWGSAALDKCPECDFEQLCFSGGLSEKGKVFLKICVFNVC